MAKKVKARRVKKVKRPAKKKVSKSRVKKIKKQAEVGLQKVGEVSHYFPHVKAAAVIILKDGLKVGDQVYVKGHTTDFKQKISSMQLDRVPILEGTKGQEIGLLVKSRVRIGDSVYKI